MNTKLFFEAMNAVGLPVTVIDTPRPWIGVDFDGVLVEYWGWQGAGRHGPPIMAMVERVQHWLDKGKDVRIFTSRCGRVYPEQVEANCRAIQLFCVHHFGKPLPITCEKDQLCEEIWDDRAIQMIRNTGLTLEEYLYRLSLHETD